MDVILSIAPLLIVLVIGLHMTVFRFKKREARILSLIQNLDKDKNK